MKNFKVIQQSKQDEKDRVAEFVKDSLRSPLRWYNLLLLAGESSVKARETLYNIKYAELRSSNLKIRKQLIRMLRELINICTTDSVLYTRLRQMAMADKLDDIKQMKEDVSVFVNSATNSISNGNTENFKNVSSVFSISEDNVDEFILAIQEQNTSEASRICNMILEEAQGVGTGLGTPFSPPSTTGIDSYDRPFSPLVKIARRFPKRFKKRDI